MTGHVYLSTACHHAQADGDAALHDYCKNATGQSSDGTQTRVKLPGRCKFCQAPCVCDCHQEGTRP